MNAVALSRAAGTPMVTFGCDIMGMANQHLETARRSLAKSVSSEAGGKHYELVLYVVDGAQGTLDPAFDAHVLPLYMWAMAHWESWLMPLQLEEAMQEAQKRVMHEGVVAWSRVAGPAAALIASASRIGWTVISGRLIRCDDGVVLDFALDPPIVITQAVRRAVRRWRLSNIAKLLPHLVPQEADLHVPHDRSQQAPQHMTTVILDFPESIDALVSVRSAAKCREFDDWQPKFRGDLKSAIAGGQWPQARLAAVPHGWTDDNRCQLCRMERGTLAHRAECPATKPHDGWQAPPAKCKKIISMITSEDRLQLLSTRGLFTLKVQVPAKPQGSYFRWMRQPPDPDQAESSTWYIDGSLFDEAKRFARRTGFGVVVVSAQGSLLGFGLGVPPEWIVDAAGAELWALYTVATLNSFLPKVVTDCKGILDTLQGCPQAASGHKRALARTWNMVRHVLDDDFVTAAALVRWMPSHESAHTLGQTRDSHGQPITPLMWRANRLADILAKAAAGQNRLPAWVTGLVASAGTWVKHQASKLGAVTHAANNFETTEVIDGGAVVRKVLRDSTAERPQYRARKRAKQIVTTAPLAVSMPRPACGESALERDFEASASAQARPHRRSGMPRISRAADVSAIVRHRKRQALSTAETLKAEAADETRVAKWIASRALVPMQGPSASERMSALRARIRTNLAS